MRLSPHSARALHNQYFGRQYAKSDDRTPGCLLSHTLLSGGEVSSVQIGICIEFHQGAPANLRTGKLDDLKESKEDNPGELPRALGRVFPLRPRHPCTVNNSTLQHIQV